MLILRPGVFLHQRRKSVISRTALEIETEFCLHVLLLRYSYVCVKKNFLIPVNHKTSNDEHVEQRDNCDLGYEDFQYFDSDFINMVLLLT